MTNKQRLINEELAQIKERAGDVTEGKSLKIGFSGKAYELYNNDGEWIADVGVSEDAEYIGHAYEDIPKLLAEVEYRREKQAELLEYNRQYFAEIKRLRAENARLEMEALK